MSEIGFFQRLRDDHGRLLAELEALESTAEAPASRPRGIDELRGLVVLLERECAAHMRAEEEALFPALVGALAEARASVTPLVAEHAELNEMLANLAGVLAGPAGPERDEQIAVQVRDFVDLFRIHVRKEDALVFRVAERVLPESTLQELAERWLLHHPRSAGEGPRTTRKGPNP